jgi:thiol-disulfide isomerase/thioredoxin
MTTLNRKVVSKPAAKKIVRYHMNGCGACEMSKEAWNDFCNNPPDGVEHEAIEEADIPKSARIKAFPTYVVFENGRERNRKEGAITTKEGITQLLPG